MKPRYFETFFNADPMVELSETAARELGSYVVEDGGSMRRYRRISDGGIDSIIYAGWEDPAEPLADLSRGNWGVQAEIHSPVERHPHGGYQWRIWYVDPTGRVKKIVEREYRADGNTSRVSRRGADGELQSYTVYRYNDDGYLHQLVTYGPDGAVMHREDV
jgi:hypothetical protein